MHYSSGVLLVEAIAVAFCITELGQPKKKEEEERRKSCFHPAPGCSSQGFGISIYTIKAFAFPDHGFEVKESKETCEKSTQQFNEL